MIYKYGSERGFTLIEMLVVMAVMAIIAGITLPAFLKIKPADEIADAVRPITQIIGSAQRTAAERGAPVMLIIDPVSYRYEARIENSDTALVQGTLELPVGATLGADSARVMFVFRPEGTADVDSLFVQTGSETAWVSVDMWDGGIHIAR